MEGQHAYKKEKTEEKEDAELKAPDSGETCTHSRALRGRGAARANPTALPSLADTNGACTAGSGRVLRDRSTRSVPLWRRKDIAEEEEEEDEEEDEAPRRRKATGPRRKKSQEAATDGTAQSEESKDNSKIQAFGNKRAQSRSWTITNRATRGSPRLVCKSEPEVETLCEEANKEAAGKKTSGDEKVEEVEDEVVLGDGSTNADEPKPQMYDPQTRSENEEGVSSDEDLPFKDDLNDQSYDPKSERDTPKTRRKAPPRLKEKKEKILVGEKVKEQEKEQETEMEVKIEGIEGADMKSELGEGPEPPRRRGRRRKDDKSPRLPKRRKKPPVQYVRCEMEGCGTVLAHPRYLQHHIKYQHLMKKKYVCPHPSCGRLFRLQKQLLRHAKHHTDQRDYICEFCARAFKSSHNLAVHRMIHTGEKPLQCEICGFTCRQKASLNWHMKKHDADATYQFSCTICGKKFEKKDSVVAHKAKSHPEVLIAEALAANAGTLVTTTTTPSGQVTHMDINPVSVLEPEGSAQGLQAPVCLSSLSADEGKRAMEGGCASLPHVAASSSQTLQTVHFVSTPISQQQQLSVQASPQVVHMTFATLPPSHQLPLLSVTHQPPLTTSSSPSSISSLPPVSAALAFTANPPPTSLSAMTSPLLHPTPPQDRKVVTTLWEGGNTNMTGDWESNGASEAQVMTDSATDQIQRVII